ncbi:MAG: hypothetical protein EAZ74_01740 [Alphaproteobacteria bacterium]|nr:MAG: hypothetical protein EAY76_01785 [Alphaproteobacteria bacterium]TAF15414.1 MAG: hypothetical protein EAZ74_01740 [Alphaproteobacteria bacterium]TAF39362.1 MAG: hypothetical protein EAZ66_04770 [Alphaproteobacteria bacterium]TAF75672.1 MAG: hypothetical protein EAZ52_06340 [Alphaproteobacteria bacterium]
MTLKYLACPHCSSTFRIPVAALSDAGKTVRCSQCAHEWHAKPSDLFDSMLDRILVDSNDKAKAHETVKELSPLDALNALLNDAEHAEQSAILDPEIKELIEHVSAFTKKHTQTVAEEEIVNPLEDLFGDFPTAPAAPIIAEQPAIATEESVAPTEPKLESEPEPKNHWSDIVLEEAKEEKFDPDLEKKLEKLSTLNPMAAAMQEAALIAEQNQRTKIRLLFIANAASFLIMLFLSVVAFRDSIIPAVPGMSAFYEMIGFASSHTVTLAEVDYDRNRAENNRWRYVVRGVMVNQGKETVAMPTLRARLFTQNGVLLNEWNIEQKGSIIESGESVPFTTRNLYSTAQNAAVLSVDAGSPVEILLRK